jgi:hypothetical protein
MRTHSCWLMTMLAAVCWVGTPIAHADTQEIAVGTGLQSATVIDSGANGICETAATPDDILLVAVGAAPPNQAEIKCGPNKLAESAAVGDDNQLVAIGAPCGNPNTAVVDTGADGVADTTAAGDDVQLVAVGTTPPNLPCIITGANGKADTPDPLGGDDVRHIATGSGVPNAAVVRCGPNRVADTQANNAVPGGDDVQLVSAGSPCANQNTIVVDSGANGIAETLAEGPDLVLKKVARAVTIWIRRGAQNKRKTIRVTVVNVESLASAPASRTYSLVATDGSCPNGTVSNVDSDARRISPGIQASASIPKGGTIRGSFDVTFGLEDITSAGKKVPFRCAVDVQADALDSAPDPDDAANPENNSLAVDFEVFDKNDLP